MDIDMPDSAAGTLRAIAAANRSASSGGTGMSGDAPGPVPVDVEIVAILASDPFDGQAAAEKLVQDALHD
jgi:hypothetical protein